MTTPAPLLLPTIVPTIISASDVPARRRAARCPGVASAALFGFLAAFDELLIALLLSGIRMQTLPVRIWNSLSLNVAPTIAAVSACLIGPLAVILLLTTALRGRVLAPRRAER